MAPTRTTRSSARNNPEHVHVHLTPEKKPARKKRRKSLFNLTGQETHIAGVSRCQRVMKEMTVELTEMKYEMESSRSKLVYTDPNRVPLKEFLDSVEKLQREQIGGVFNKMVLSALYPPEGAEPPTIPQLESAWGEILPLIKEVNVEYTRLCKLRDNNWVAPDPPKTKKTPKKKKAPAKRKGRKKEEDKEN